MSDYDQNDEQNDGDYQNDDDEIESASSEQPTELLDREVLHLQNDIKYLTRDLDRADAEFTEADRDETKAIIRKQQETSANADANLHHGTPDGPP